MVNPRRAVTEGHPKTARCVAEGVWPALVILDDLDGAHGQIVISRRYPAQCQRQGRTLVVCGLRRTGRWRSAGAREAPVIKQDSRHRATTAQWPPSPSAKKAPRTHRPLIGF